GIATNLEFSLLQRFLTDVLLDAPELEDVQLLDRARLHVWLLDVLRDEDFLEDERLEPVRDYLDHGWDDPDIGDMRRYQLAGRLATLFEEYSYSRPDMLEGWNDGEFSSDDPSPVEVWQRVIWNELTGGAPVVERDGERFTPLSHVFSEEFVTDPLLERAADRLETCHLFALPQLGRAFRDVLERLGEAGAHLHLYVLDPSREKWSDMPTGRHDARDWEADVVIPDDDWRPEDENPALRMWGRVGRDYLHALEGMSDRQHRSFSAPDGETILHALQRDIVEGRPEHIDRSDALDEDGTVEFVACPGIKREVEIVANEIWSLVEESRRRGDDEPLYLDEIAVIVDDAQLEKYVAQIKSVFDGFYDLPYNIFGLSARAESRVVEAAQLLIELPFGDFRRSELLRLLVHPNVRGQCNEVDPDTWVQWCEDLNILHGGSREDHRDTYIDGDLYNWEQGMRRLALGAFMRGERSDLDEPFEHPPERLAADGGRGGNRMRPWPYYPREIAAGDLAPASQFSALARSLIADARWLRDQSGELTLTEWAELFAEYLDTYLVPSDEDARSSKAERRELDRCVYALRGLANIASSGKRVSLRTASLFALDRLDQLQTSTGRKFVDGVVVSSIDRLRALPFEHVFMLGMGEGSFPAVDAHDQLDLRRQKWQRGDVLLSERDKYAFLETLMSTRRGLHLSWVAFDVITGEALAPSSLISELRAYLERFRLAAESDGACTTVHPLRRFDRAAGYFPDLPDRPAAGLVSKLPGSAPERPNLHPEAFAEAKMDALGEDLEHLRLDHDTPLPRLDLQALRQRLAAARADDDKKKAQPRHLRITPLPSTDDILEARAEAVEGRTIRVSISQLEGFLSAPIQAAAKKKLGLYEEEDGDPLDKERETFGTSNGTSSYILSRVFYRALAQPERPLTSELLERTYLNWVLPHFEITGDLPHGPFLDKTRRDHLEALRHWRDVLEKYPEKHVPELAPILERPPTIVGMGRDRPWVTETRTPLEFHLSLDGGCEANKTARVQITGTTRPIIPGTNATLSLRKGGISKQGDERYFIRSYVSYLVMRALGYGTSHDHGHAVVLFTKEGKCPRDKPSVWRKLSAISSNAAYDHLETLLHEFLTEPHDYVFAVEIARNYLEDRRKAAINGERPPAFGKEVIEDLNRGKPAWMTGSYRYGPISVDQLQNDFDPPDDPDALIERRYKYYEFRTS
ncbi:MAG: exodeoxyribonuclease V subunit gamma, partial [Persicimonas sp.]